MASDPSTGPAARPRRRWGRAVGATILVGLTILLTWRATTLSGLPDIGDPFDVETFCAPIPDETNAFILYKQAVAAMAKGPGQPTTSWATAGPAERKWLEDSRPALDLWRRGTERPDSLYVSPRTINFATILPVIQGMRGLARLAVLEGTRKEAEGDLEAALGWYVALLRSSRHCGRRGVPIERLVGIAIGSMASTRLTAWAADPKVDAAMLRKALDAVLAADALTPPDSDAVKGEYLSSIHSITDPSFNDPSALAALAAPVAPVRGIRPAGAYLRALKVIKKEPERSRRVLRLVTANWLAYCDRPQSQRPPFAAITTPPGFVARPGSPGVVLYATDASAPASARALSPDELVRWARSTLYAEICLPSFAAIQKAQDRDRATRANLMLTLANELYKREHGQYPDRVEDLVGPYLKSLPEGYTSVK